MNGLFRFCLTCFAAVAATAPVAAQDMSMSVASVQ